MTNNNTTANSITIAARTEAAHRDMDPGRTGENNRAWFVAGAEWQAAQEPTDAEVEAADRGRVEHNIRRRMTDAEWAATRSRVEHEAMRAALSAARKA